jgi:hypothetical protein
VLCDHCPRSICTKCLVIPEKTFGPKVTFVCLSCHEKVFRGSQPYFVSFSSHSLSLTNLNVFKGFYTISGQVSTPTLTRKPQSFIPSHLAPLEVTGKYHWTSHSQISSEHLLILHFILAGISPIGSACHVLVEYMKAFLDSSRLYFEEIVFDFSQTVLNDSLEQKLRMLCQSFR